MTWSLNATGHVQDAAAEKKLLGELRGVLAKYGGTASSFGGTFTGLVHDLHVPDTTTKQQPKTAAKQP